MVPIVSADCSVNGNIALREEDIIVLDGLLRLRAIGKTHVPLLCFPNTERSIIDYEEFSGRDIDRFVDQAAKYFMKCDLQPVS